MQQAENTQLSVRVKTTIAMSLKEALRLGHHCVGTGHLLLGLIKEGGDNPNNAIRILKDLECDISVLKKRIEDSIIPINISISGNNIEFTLQAGRAIKTSYLRTGFSKTVCVETQHLLLSLLYYDNSIVYSVLKQGFNITHENVHSLVYLHTSAKDSLFEEENALNE